MDILVRRAGIQRYLRPATIGEAVGLLDELGASARVVGGGTDLSIHPPPRLTTLLDLSGLDLRYVEDRGTTVAIGATATLTDLFEHRALAAYGSGVLPRMLSGLGSPALRNVATVGGHLVRARFSDLIPVLLALDAEVSFTDGAEHVTTLADFYRTESHRNPMILTEVRLPSSWAGSRAAFVRFARAAFDFPILNCAAAVMFDADVVADARFVVGETPQLAARVDPVEQLLVDAALDDSAVEAAARASQAAVEVGDDARASAGYRRQLVYVATRRVLNEIAGRPELSP